MSLSNNIGMSQKKWKNICTFHCKQHEGVCLTNYRIHKFANSKNLNAFIDELYKNKRAAIYGRFLRKKIFSCPPFKKYLQTIRKYTFILI